MTRFEPGDDPETRRAKGAYESFSATKGGWAGFVTLLIGAAIAVGAWLLLR